MSGLLSLISRTERWITIAAFALMAVSLMADVISRRLFMTGLIGATEVAVIGMVAVAMFGIGVATDEGGHLRPRLFDALIPKAAEPLVNRVASAVTGLFFAVFAGLSAFMIAQSFVLGDRTEILRAPVWALQAMIFLAFATNAVRFFIHAARPDLKPSEDLEESSAGAADGDPHDPKDPDGEPR
ncbi:MAG: TRAP transporter small permease [Oceanicaulis sp.]